MRTFPQILIITLLTLCSCGGGSSDGSSSACSAFRVLNGQECGDSNIPVVRLELQSRRGTALCTGTIIANDWVLTAAHCLLGATEARIFHDHGEQAATQAFANPLFVFTNDPGAFDLGLLRADNIASNLNVTPASFFTERQPAPSDAVRFIGYGMDGSPVLPNGNPRGTELTIIEVKQGLIFSSFDFGNTGVCSGDSGGALTLDGRIIGVASFKFGAPGCADNNFNAFSNILINGNVAFLKQHVPDLPF